MEKGVLTPKEVAQSAVDVAVNKAGLNGWKMFILAVMAGLFIALAGNGSSISAYSVESVGMSKMISGLIFTSGLLMVLITGAELFTGNALMLAGVAQKKITVISMLRNWGIVYLGNFIGGVLLAFLISLTTQPHMEQGKAGAYAIHVALDKSNLDLMTALIMGFFCNFLVCVAVWISWAGKELVSKAVGVFMPIWLFVTAGFEHCVANMYFIPAGIFEKNDALSVNLAMEQYGITQTQLDSLNWGNFLMGNLLPVTIGNIAGGAFVALVYWFVFLRKEKV